MIAVDEVDRYVGLVQVADAHAAEAASDKSVKDLLRHREDMLLPAWR